jgi:hypothetical protein
MKTVKQTVDQLSNEAKNTCAAEFSVLMEFFKDLAEDERRRSVFVASCDEFINWARRIKKEFKEGK